MNGNRETDKPKRFRAGFEYAGHFIIPDYYYWNGHRLYIWNTIARGWQKSLYATPAELHEVVDLEPIDKFPDAIEEQKRPCIYGGPS